MNKCQHCGTELKPGVKFCTKCGAPVEETRGNMSGTVTATETTRSNNNETIAQIKKHSMNYFTWYKNSLKHPSLVNYDNNYNGLITLALNSMLLAYSFYFVINRILSLLKVQAGGIYGSTIITGFPLYIRFFLMAVVYYGIFFVVGFACKKYLINKNETIFNYANQLGSYCSSILVLRLIVILLLFLSMPSNLAITSNNALAGQLQFFVVLIVIISSVWNVSYIASIIMNEAKVHFDKIYAAISVMLASNVVLYLISKTIFGSFSGIFMQFLKGMIG